MAGNFFLFREIRIMKEVEMILQTCEMSDRINLKHGEFFRLLGKCFSQIASLLFGFSSSWQKKNHSNKYIYKIDLKSVVVLFYIFI